MHRATPLNTSIRAYTAGGSRSVVDKVDDTKLMQEMGGNFMANETRDAIEAAQNYGFTSVVFDAEKGQDGKIAASAETFIGFMGGNRSFPASGNMDDRRHRLLQAGEGRHRDVSRARRQAAIPHDARTAASGPRRRTRRAHAARCSRTARATPPCSKAAAQAAGGGAGATAARWRAAAAARAAAHRARAASRSADRRRSTRTARSRRCFVEVTKDKTRIVGQDRAHDAR